jgi:hypothetical protein
MQQPAGKLKEDKSNPAEKTTDNLEKTVAAGAKIPEEQDISLFLKEKNKLPSYQKISLYTYTSLDSICRVREVELKKLLELIGKLKIEIKYQDIKDKKVLYVSSDDATKISGEILTAQYKSRH